MLLRRQILVRRYPRRQLCIGRSPRKQIRIGRSPRKQIRIGRSPRKQLCIGRSPRRHLLVRRYPHRHLLVRRYPHRQIRVRRGPRTSASVDLRVGSSTVTNRAYKEAACRQPHQPMNLPGCHGLVAQIGYMGGPRSCRRSAGRNASQSLKSRVVLQPKGGSCGGTNDPRAQRIVWATARSRGKAESWRRTNDPGYLSWIMAGGQRSKGRKTSREQRGHQVYS